METIEQMLTTADAGETRTGMGANLPRGGEPGDLRDAGGDPRNVGGDPRDAGGDLRDDGGDLRDAGDLRDVDWIAEDFIQKYVPKQDITDAAGQVIITREQGLHMGRQCWQALKDTIASDIYQWKRPQITAYLGEEIDDAMDIAVEEFDME